MVAMHDVTCVCVCITEAANQSTSRPYPPAGLILRSNSLQKNDDQTICEFKK